MIPRCRIREGNQSQRLCFDLWIPPALSSQKAFYDKLFSDQFAPDSMRFWMQPPPKSVLPGPTTPPKPTAEQLKAQNDRLTGGSSDQKEGGGPPPPPRQPSPAPGGAPSRGPPPPPGAGGAPLQRPSVAPGGGPPPMRQMSGTPGAPPVPMRPAPGATPGPPMARRAPPPPPGR